MCTGAEAEGIVVRGPAEGSESQERAKLGMWIFLGTEVLFFAGLFLLYAAYRSRYGADFRAAAGHMHVFQGSVNTLVLLTSSATMALGVSALQRGDIRASVRFQLTTVALGCAFLAVKYTEWGSAILDGFYPGSPELEGQAHGVVLFCSLYFIMTGLHAAHVIVGVGLIASTAGLTLNGRLGAENGVLLENTGLFWHLVDAVWIYLWPLFYLIH